MKNSKTFLLVIAACFLAIASKIILPSSVNEQNFDSFLVLKFGFPIVATLYFIMIYSHNAFITKFFAAKSELSNTQCGVRFGICFGLIYLMGMQEVVVESSPFSEWGIQFVVYQFAMGIGEALMAFLLCFCTDKFIVSPKTPATNKTSLSTKNKITYTLTIAVVFFLERTVLYNAGIISSNIKTFPIPTYIWTFIFGITLGFCFCLIYPIFSKNKNQQTSPHIAEAQKTDHKTTRTNQTFLCLKICVLSIGLCWLGFNLFIALIFKDSILDIITRWSFDIVFLFLVCWLNCKLFQKQHNN